MYVNVHRNSSRSTCDAAVGPVQIKQSKPQLLAEEIRGFIALLPFNVTAQTWLLDWIDGLICQNGLNGCPQILSCHRNLIAWPAPVELPPLDQCALAIK